MSPTIPNTTSHHHTTLLHSYVQLDFWVWVSSLSLVLWPFMTFVHWFCFWKYAEIIFTEMLSFVLSESESEAESLSKTIFNL